VTAGDRDQTESAARLAAVPGLERDGPATIHGQVSRRMRELISSDAWPDHFRLPAEPALAAELGVARGTLRRAISTLADEGLLVRSRGRGTFVRSGEMEQPIGQELLSISESMDRLGVGYQTDVLEQSVEAAAPRIAALLGIGEGSPMLRLVRRRSVGHEPVALFVNLVRTDLCPGIERFDFARRRLFDVIESDYRLPIAFGRRTFEARLADDETAERLGVPASVPVLYLEQITYLSSGEAIEYSDVWIVGNRLRISSVLRRRQR
jgi:DNA-binding GntR family transcriptional regulator